MWRRASSASACRAAAFLCSHGPQQHQHQRQADQDRHDRGERRGRQDEQQQCPDHRPDERHRREPPQGRPVPLQLGTVAVDPGETAGDEPHRVGHVGHDRRVAEQQQHGEGDEGAGADDGVDGPGQHPGDQQRDDLHDGHPVTLATGDRVFAGWLSSGPCGPLGVALHRTVQRERRRRGLRGRRVDQSAVALGGPRLERPAPAGDAGGVTLGLGAGACRLLTRLGKGPGGVLQHGVVERGEQGLAGVDPPRPPPPRPGRPGRCRRGRCRCP